MVDAGGFPTSGSTPLSFVQGSCDLVLGAWVCGWMLLPSLVGATQLLPTSATSCAAAWT